MSVEEKIKAMESQLIRHDERINNIKDSQTELKNKVENLEKMTNTIITQVTKIDEKFDEFNKNLTDNNKDINENLNHLNELVQKGKSLKESFTFLLSCFGIVSSIIYFIYINFFQSI